ncbi:hypothetical protein CRG98_028197, partial [Punica granatum]
MLRLLHPFAWLLPQRARLPFTEAFPSSPPVSTFNLSTTHSGTSGSSSSIYTARASGGQGSSSTQNLKREESGGIYDFGEDEDEEGEEDEFSSRSGFKGREDERNYDKDPEFADILGSCLDDPQKALTK